MEKQLIMKMQGQLDALAQEIPGEDVEYWFARGLQKVLGYAQWRNLQEVIAKAKDSCKNAGVAIEDHFADVSKKVEIGSGAERSIEDVMLTRYACYLIAQNGDPRKEPIAFAQSYFAIQTRKQELIEERIRLQERLQARQKLRESETELSKNIYERGVDDRGFGRIRSKGDAALFGGKTTGQMKSQLGVPTNRPLADFLPTVTSPPRTSPPRSPTIMSEETISRASFPSPRSTSRTTRASVRYCSSGEFNRKRCHQRKI